MLLLASTLLRWPKSDRPRRWMALAAPLAFALSPLVLLWSRIAVSDALFSALVSISVLLAWRCLVGGGSPWMPWVVLGLAVVRRLVQQLGGELTATSKLGQGSEFVVQLPLHFAGNLALPAAVDADLSVQEPAKAWPLHILLAEADPLVDEGVEYADRR